MPKERKGSLILMREEAGGDKIRAGLDKAEIIANDSCGGPPLCYT